jgi:GWxTD domain-containing protein
MRRILVLIIIPLLFADCSSSNRALQSVNMAYLYQIDLAGFRPNFHLSRISDNELQVFYSFDATNLLFAKDTETNILRGAVRFTYKVLPSIDARMPIDTGSVLYNDIFSNEQRIIGSFSVDLSQLSTENTQPVLVIYSMDVNRHFSVVHFESIQNVNPDQEQNWSLFKDGKRALSNFIPEGNQVSVSHRGKELDVWVEYFPFETFSLALPPFSTKPVLDNLSALSEDAFLLDAGASFLLNKPGIYTIRRNSSSVSGLTIFAVEGHYPMVTRRKELVGPMRYITTKREYEQLVVSDDPAEIKMAVDRFWLERGKSVDRAQNLIAAFYGRVEQSNVLFSSYKEGWKTDRGLIYTIFGPPNIVTATDIGERWVYGEENATFRYVFHFKRTEGSLSNNDFELIRDENYRYAWGLAIEAWRLGKVYNIKEIKREQDEREQQIRLRQQPFFWY